MMDDSFCKQICLDGIVSISIQYHFINGFVWFVFYQQLVIYILTVNKSFSNKK